MHDYNGAMIASAPRPRCRERGVAQAAQRAASRAAGFTLIEIMVVIVILGVLAALVVPSILSRTDDARIVAAKTALGAIRQALKLYRLDNQRYPSNEQGLSALVERPADPSLKNWRPGGYIQQGSLKDPWGNEYQYVFPGTHGRDFDLFSFGENGQEGGGDASSVIGNWNLDGSGSGGGNPATAASGR